MLGGCPKKTQKKKHLPKMLFIHEIKQCGFLYGIDILKKNEEGCARYIIYLYLVYS